MAYKKWTLNVFPLQENFFMTVDLSQFQCENVAVKVSVLKTKIA